MAFKRLFSVLVFLLLYSPVLAQDVPELGEENENAPSTAIDVILELPEALALPLKTHSDVDRYMQAVASSPSVECETIYGQETCRYNDKILSQTTEGVDNVIRTFYKDDVKIYESNATETSFTEEYLVGVKDEIIREEEMEGEFDIVNQGKPIVRRGAVQPLNLTLMKPEPVKDPLTRIFDFLFSWLR